ncbi:hypothetical protein GCM10027615_43110 [Plantactinospora veratri]
MVLEGERNGCATEVSVIAAALSIQDPRERPADRQAQADQAHARFTDKESDFAALLNLWRYLQEQQRALSSSGFRRMCKAEYLNYLRVREWQDIHSQLRQVLRTTGGAAPDGRPGRGRGGGDSATDGPATGTPTAPAGDATPEDVDTDRIHQSLLAGLLSHVGLKETQKNEYLGARGPSSPSSRARRCSASRRAG